MDKYLGGRCCFGLGRGLVLNGNELSPGVVEVEGWLYVVSPSDGRRFSHSSFISKLHGVVTFWSYSVVDAFVITFKVVYVSIS